MTITSAADGGYIDEASDALATGNVFVSSEVSGAASLENQLQGQVAQGGPLAIAVFSDNAELEASGPDIVSALAAAHPQYSTIIVAVGDDLSAGSRALPSGEAMRIANEAEGSSDDVGTALTETIVGVQSAGDQNGADTPTGLDGGAIVGIVLAAAAVLAGIGIAVGLISRNRRSRASADKRLPEGVEAQLVVLRALGPQYAALAASGNQIAAQTRDDLEAIVTNTPELFARIDRRSAEGQLSIAAVEYDDKLRKLTAAVGRDYLFDILTHRNLWDDPDDRVREVQGAVTAVSDELVENIKQVNARRGLHFQVSLDGLIGKRKELQDWEREFNSANDEPDRPQTGA